MSVLNKLTEGIVSRDLRQEGDALLSKWEKTGLLEGLDSDTSKNGMARLLENQAKQLLKEASSMAGGDVEGFASVAFPLVRRVFGGLLANDLVSVQPMSLPSGLIFFMDFTYTNSRLGLEADESVYGGGRVAKGIQLGLNDVKESGGGFYNLANAYSHPTASSAALVAHGNVVLASTQMDTTTDANKKLIRFDPDILATTDHVLIFKTPSAITTDLPNFNTDMVTAVEVVAGTYNLGGGTQARRLTFIDADNKLNIVLTAATAITAPTSTQNVTLKYPIADKFDNGGATPGSVVGADPWGLEEASNVAGTATRTAAAAAKDIIPEIDIKVDSVAVTAMTKKLKAKWSPELGQDLNAYHNLDAEVELTSILSEQIALEIDREIVNDLIQGATAGTYYWSRSPGMFLNRVTGAEIGAASAAPDFTGTVSEWYETLIETINDVSARIHVKTLRGGANFLVTSPEVANILEFTAGFRASVTADSDRGTAGAVNVGSISKKFDVYVDPYFPRNVVLVGRKGGSFLESGYVYAPYVPLQVTPTIFGTEDFVPRKGVLTRYAKKMVRPDMYGLVICRGLLGEAGATS